MSAWDIGDLVPTGITVANAAGIPVDSDGTLTCTITDPNNVTWANPGSFTISHDGPGLYSATFLAQVPGIHQINWTNTGSYSAAFNDCFWVGPNGGLIISVAEAIEALNLASTPNPAMYVERLRTFIMGVTAVVESIVGPVLPITVDEYLDGGSPIILLSRAPVLAVNSVVEAGGGGFIRVLTNEPPDSSNIDSFGYSVDLDSGSIIRRISGLAAPFLPGRRNVHVNYSAGQSAAPNIREAALDLIRINWQPVQGGNRPGYDKPGQADINVDGAWKMGFFVPNRVMEQLVPSRHVWGIA